MILKALFRSFENPATPLSDPDNWLIDDLGGGRSATGVAVNASSTLTYSPFWRGVNLISRDVAKLPLIVYERLEGGGKERATKHPAYRLLRYRPNDAMHAVDFRKLIQAQAILQGNGCAFIERAGSGAPGALLPVNWQRVRVLRLGGLVWYLIDVDGETVKVPASDMLHIKGLPDWTSEGLVGMSLVQKAKESIGLGLGAQEYGARFFDNDASPGAVLEHPGRLSPKAKENIVESWEKAHRGLSRKHKIAVLEEGMKINPYTVTPEEAQFLETRQFQYRDASNWLGVPPHRLGDTTRTSFASLEQENQSYLDDALDGWLVAWEAESHQKLLTERQQAADSHVIEFLRSALVRADLRVRTDAYSRAILGGWMMPDEARERENLGPLPNGAGKVVFRPSNVTVAGENGRKSGSPDGPAPTSQDPGGEVADPARGPGDADGPAGGRDDGGPLDTLLRDAARRIVRRATLTSVRVAKGWQEPRWRAHLEVLAQRHLETATGILAPVVAVAGVEPAAASRWAGELLGAVAAALAPCRSPEDVRAAAAALDAEVCSVFPRKIRAQPLPPPTGSNEQR